jgi:hypothetical protein
VEVAKMSDLNNNLPPDYKKFLQEFPEVKNWLVIPDLVKNPLAQRYLRKYLDKSKKRKVAVHPEAKSIIFAALPELKRLWEAIKAAGPLQKTQEIRKLAALEWFAVHQQELKYITKQILKDAPEDLLVGAEKRIFFQKVMQLILRDRDFGDSYSDTFIWQEIKIIEKTMTEQK